MYYVVSKRMPDALVTISKNQGAVAEFIAVNGNSNIGCRKSVKVSTGW